MVLFLGGAVYMAQAAEETESRSDIIGSIVDNARKYVRATNWEPGFSFAHFSYGYYCNIFVADVIRESNGDTWDRIQESVGIIQERDPVAAEWANPNFHIKGWVVVFPTDQTKNLTAKQILALRKAGDVVATSKGSKHVGIISDESKAISASSITGAIEHNNWSWRLPLQSKFSSTNEYENQARQKISTYTVRRFIGVSLEPQKPLDLRPIP